MGIMKWYCEDCFEEKAREDEWDNISLVSPKGWASVFFGELESAAVCTKCGVPHINGVAIECN